MNMELVVITAQGDVKNEVETLKALLSKGMKRLHIRKPDWDREQVKGLLKALGKRHFKKIALHGHPDIVKELNLGGIHLGAEDELPEMGKWQGRVSRSYHSFKEVTDCIKGELQYCWISPVFNSISKPDHKSAFSEDELRKFLRGKRRCAIYALGGVHPERMDLVKDMGFDGAALLGSIWQKADVKERVEVFEEMLERCLDMESGF